ncbi:MAG TPA: hypothetical protein VG826_35475 [Pirellulales bacterium]|nr:hypothetical protein [Pirellulales bacterium]
MSRRFQFSLRVTVAVAIAAAYCAFLAWLPPGARVGVVALSIWLAWELFWDRPSRSEKTSE